MPHDRFRVHGLDIASALPLNERRAPTGVRPDLTIAAVERGPVDTAPEGRVVAALDRPGAWYRAVVDDRCLHFFVTGVAAISVELATGAVRTRAAEGTDDELLALLVAGNVLALWLGVRGEHVLHASGVVAEGTGLAFVGGSGSGKSTLAAVLCADGARLIGDDLIRLVDGASPPACHSGSAEIRVRAGAGGVADRFAPDRRRPTVDGRVAVRPDHVDDGAIGIDALVFPRHVRGHGGIDVRPLARGAALPHLLAGSRVAGWRDPAILKTQFRAYADLAERVPAVVVTVPWGPPFPAPLLPRLLDALAAEGVAGSAA